MVKKLVESTTGAVALRYLSYMDLKKGSSLREKFSLSQEQCVAYKRAVDHPTYRTLLVSIGNEPVAVILISRKGNQAIIHALQERIKDSLTDTVYGRIADFLSVDWVIAHFDTEDEGKEFGQRWGRRHYRGDLMSPIGRKPLVLDSKGMHISGMRFLDLSREDLRKLDEKLVEQVRDLCETEMHNDARLDQVGNLPYGASDEYHGPSSGINSRLNNSRVRHFVIYDPSNRQIAGVASVENINPECSKHHRFLGLTVAPDYQKNGLGRLLLQFAMSRICRLATDVSIGLHDTNTRLRELIERHGAFKQEYVERGACRLINGYYKRSSNATEEFLIPVEELY